MQVLISFMEIMSSARFYAGEKFHFELLNLHMISAVKWGAWKVERNLRAG